MTPVEPAVWTADDRALWARIAAHEFETPGDALSFTGRLARDHGWTLDVARGAVEEYRRFCFLALRRDGAVTPSEEVDEVWHQHLTFSRDYWQVWCRVVLRADLHHEPTRGGPVENRRFVVQYASTLARYEAWFGPPPPTFWPGTAGRFGGGPRFRMVDRATHVALPLPRALVTAAWRSARVLGLGLVLATLPSGPASAAGLGLLDWTAGPFLAFYVAAVTLSLAAVYAIPLLLASSTDGAPPRARWDPAELALLAGGRQRAADVLTLRAIMDGDATIAGSKVVIDGRETTRAALFWELSGTLEALRLRLAGEGLALSAAREGVVRLATCLVALPVVGLGLAKTAVGHARDKPVGLLGFLIAVLVLGTLVIAFTRRPASREGRRALAAYRERHARALRAPRSEEVLAAFACGGAAALVGTDLEAFGALLKSNDGASACGGAGGCGGGGCGGCGGD